MAPDAPPRIMATFHLAVTGYPSLRWSGMDTRHQQWHTPPSCIAPGMDEVHIWRAALDVSADMLFRLRSTLSDDERTRADRFYFEKDRVRFAAAHGILRDILSRYSGVAPAELRFSAGSHGKPALKVTVAGEGVGFNMSHSRWMALYAVAPHGEVGVDIEYIREKFESERIAERFFHEAETANLRRFPAREQRAVFFKYWTYKEAYIKARGEGLSIPTRSFIVRISDDGRAAIEHEKPASAGHTGMHAGQTHRWSLFALDPAPEYVGAVAVEGYDTKLVLWEW